MSSIYRIKENMGTYTDTELRIANYILENKEYVITLSSQKLAEAVDSSAAAVVRFSKKIGYKGFTHLKVELAKSKEDIEVIDSINRLITQDDSVQTMIQKSKFGNAETFDKTYKLLDVDQLVKAIETLKGARRIYLLGIGGSSLPAQDLYQKLTRIDKQVLYFDDFHLMVSAMTHINQHDVVIAFSYSGMTREILIAQREATEGGACVIAVTQVGRNDLSRYADIVLHIPKEESELRLGSIASRFSMLAVSDLLYLGVAKDDIDSTRKKLVASRQSVKTIRDI